MDDERSAVEILADHVATIKRLRAELTAMENRLEREIANHGDTASREHYYRLELDDVKVALPKDWHPGLAPGKRVEYMVQEWRCARMSTRTLDWHMGKASCKGKLIGMVHKSFQPERAGEWYWCLLGSDTDLDGFVESEEAAMAAVENSTSKDSLTVGSVSKGAAGAKRTTVDTHGGLCR